MKVYFDTVGCRLNQSEIEKMAAQVRANGHEVVARASQADIVVVNTCAVTRAACADSRKKIRKAARAGNAQIIATGCYTTIAPDEISVLPQVRWQVPNYEKDELVRTILGGDPQEDSSEVRARIALPGKQRRTRAFIKVQDGCDNFCTFCITRIARGKSRSQSRREIYSDIESALVGGVKEIVLTGVNLGAWGADLRQKPSLSSLIKDVIKEFSPPRLRLSSLEPWNIDSDFLEVLTLPGFCRHLHMPLQSGSADVLRKMGRRNTHEEYRQLLAKIRNVIPEIAITTDIMVGFPGEGEEEFSESLEFVKAMNFAAGHVFNFSLRPGTAAEKLGDRVPAAIRKRRSELMREVFENSREKYQARFIGKTERVLWERSEQVGGGWLLDGLTDNYLRVQVVEQSDQWNELKNVKLLELGAKSIKGEVVI